MQFLYNVVLFLFFMPALAVLALRHRKRFRSEFLSYRKEKTGRWDIPAWFFRAQRPLLWIHGASLGEVRAVEPLIRELREYRFLLTVQTHAGREYAEKHAVADLVRCAPLDLVPFVNRALNAGAIRARGLILVETELWPNLLDAAQRCSMKTVLINGRLSHRSYPYYRFTRSFWQPVLSKIDRLAARSDDDAERFLSLGFPVDRMMVTGNIKYDRDFSVSGFSRQDIGCSADDILWVAGSTREHEEEIIVEAWQLLKRKYPALKLVIAPRHLSRLPGVQKMLVKRGVRFALRSTVAQQPFDCLLIDTFGELQKIYAVSDIVFVGGSLVNKGGQNPIEPAACAKPVLFGPWMQNFESEAKALETAGGGIRVKGIEYLVSAVEPFLSDSGRRSAIGSKAFECVEQQKGALKKTAELIRSIMK